MDLRILLTAFSTVFIAELGDKTQLATFTLSSASGSRWSVFAGASLALVANVAIAVLAADLVKQWVSPELVKKASGVLFVAIGLWYFFSRE